MYSNNEVYGLFSVQGGTKGKKKGKGPTIGKATAKLDFTAYDDEVGDEFDDFM